MYPGRDVLSLPDPPRPRRPEPRTGRPGLDGAPEPPDLARMLSSLRLAVLAIEDGRLGLRVALRLSVVPWVTEESVGDTWVTDMRHYDYPDEQAHAVTREGVRLATYFASIVEGTVGGPRLGGATGVRCRRRPGRLPCSGVILSELHSGGHELRWWCPVCRDNGVISNWAGTRWDPARKVERYRSGQVFGRESAPNVPRSDEHETIQGTIRWDEGSENDLPKIVTAEGKEYAWVELGKELMIHEGWRVKIELG